MSCLKIFGYFLGFMFLAAVVGSVELATGVIIGLVVIAAIFTISKNQVAKKQMSEVLSENIEWQVSQKLADYVMAKAIALEGDGSYGFRVVGEKYHVEAFKELAEHMQIEKSETVRLQTQLICQPNNPHDQFAVAVTLGGFLLGWVPKFASERLHNFLMQHGGVAGVNTQLKFDLKSNEFEVDLDLTEPYTKMNVKPFEA